MLIINDHAADVRSQKTPADTAEGSTNAAPHAPSSDGDEEFYEYADDDSLAGFALHLFQQIKREKLVSVKDEPTLPVPVHWGWKVGKVHLSNTCPLDNFLVIFWAALHNFSWLREFFELNSNDDSFSENICSALQLVDEGKSAEAKVLWAEFLTVELD